MEVGFLLESVGESFLTFAAFEIRSENTFSILNIFSTENIFQFRDFSDLLKTIFLEK